MMRIKYVSYALQYQSSNYQYNYRLYTFRDDDMAASITAVCTVINGYTGDSSVCIYKKD